jgi:hypothetical protein
MKHFEKQNLIRAWQLDLRRLGMLGRMLRLYLLEDAVP